MENLHRGIRSIKIRDFRGISHLDLSFLGLKCLPTPVAVIGGPNGSGKTAALEACLWAAGYRGALNGKTSIEAIRSGTNSFEVEISLQLGPGSPQNYHYGPSSIPEAGFPSVYFSSWRAPGLVGALGITSGKRGRRPDRTEQNHPRLDQRCDFPAHTGLEKWQLEADVFRQGDSAAGANFNYENSDSRVSFNEGFTNAGTLLLSPASGTGELVFVSNASLVNTATGAINVVGTAPIGIGANSSVTVLVNNGAVNYYPMAQRP